MKYFNLIAFSVTAGVCLSASLAPAQADGSVGVAGSDNGGAGPFRRVKTDSFGFIGTGYYGVRGNFTVPTLFLAPYDEDIKTTPDLYLGGGQASGKVEIDAGVDYERAIQGAPDGWTVVVRVSGGPNPAPVNAKPVWRAGPGTPNPGVTSFDQTWLVDINKNLANGNPNPNYLTATLQVTANGAETQPDGNGVVAASDGLPIFIDAANLGLNVKRVMAVAQDGTAYKEEGSYMRGSVFTNGQVLVTIPIPVPPIGLLDVPLWINFSQAGINQNTGPVVTGYGPDGKDHGVLTTNKNIPAARYIVDFPGRGTTPQARNAADPARYDNESVDVNMLKRRKTSGKLITPDSVTAGKQ